MNSKQLEEGGGMDMLRSTPAAIEGVTKPEENVPLTGRGGAEFPLMRIGSVAGIVGALLGMVGNLIHPSTPSGDPEGVARTIADSEIWIADHLAIVMGLILMFGGLVAIARSLEVENALVHALSRLGYVAAIAGITVGLILVILDGVAAKHLADAWASAPADEKSIALAAVTSEETFNFALAALFNILFAGVTFILYGLAVATSHVYPRWLGWVVVIAGAGSIVVGSIQAYVGESTSVTRTLTIIFPTVITLWLAQMGVLLLRRVSSWERA
jgi:Domain of unknown function (DUF4386)